MGKNTPKKSKLKRLNNYYQYTGFYKFVGNSIRKALPAIIGIVVVIILINTYVINLGDFFKGLTQTLEPIWVLSIFFISESILGLIPPEIFIAWSAKMDDPIFFLSMLALLSYVGGLISYFIGVFIQAIPSIHRYMETKMKKYLKNTSKWGGFLIVVGALLPIPFSITCMAAGIIKYPFKYVILYGLLRFLRFALYALIIFNVL